MDNICLWGRIEEQSEFVGSTMTIETDTGIGNQRGGGGLDGTGHSTGMRVVS